MRPLLALLRVLGVFTIFAGLVFAGSAAVREAHGRPEATSLTANNSSKASSATRTTAHGATNPPMPSGGAPLHLTPRCDPTTTRPTASTLLAGTRALATPDWHSADGGVSAPLGDGRVVWLYGDTRKQPGASSVGMVSNSMLISSGACFSQAIARDKLSVIPDPGSPDDHLERWPTAVTAVDRGAWSEVFVFTNTVLKGRGFWSFILLGSSVTRFAVPDGGAPVRLETTQISADEKASDHITWGTAVAVGGDWVNVYGTRVKGGSLGREVYLARTRLADLTDMKAWQFHTASGWGTIERAAPVVGAQPGVSHIISAFPHSGAWWIVSKAGGDLGNDIGVWRGPSPDGPYTLVRRERRAYDMGGHQIRYMPLVHPEFATGRQMVVSMSRNVTQGPGVLRDRMVGRPEFFTLTLP